MSRISIDGKSLSDEQERAVERALERANEEWAPCMELRTVLAHLDAAPPTAPIVIHGHVSDIFDDTDAGEGVSIDGGHDGGYVIIEWKRHGLKNGDRVAVEVRRMGDDS